MALDDTLFPLPDRQPTPIAWPACDVPPPRIVSGHFNLPQIWTTRIWLRNVC